MIEVNNKKLCESCFSKVESENACPCCGFEKSEYAPDPMVLPMGTKLADKIIIGKVMGKGGFGVTYLGYDIRMEKVIAVKEYYPNGIAYRAPGGTEISINDSKSNETFAKGAEKFYTEAEMVAQFNGNPNIVSVYDYFRANNTVYLIMEFIRGITLKNYIKNHGRLSDGQALYVMDKIAAALSITHSAGVLHRDISPDNIMLCKDGKVKLIDFGAARQIMAESSSNLTVVMKPGYTPIEQYTKKGRQGAWTDIYSLGVSVYYALTEVIIDDPYARMDSDEELSENRHGINSDLWGILKKCTMINASERYGSAIDLRKALMQVSAPIKSEAIVLSDDDLRDDREKVFEAAEASENGEKDFSADETAAAAENAVEEVIEVFEDSNTLSSDTPEIIPDSSEPEGNPTYQNDKGKNKKIIIGGICTAAVILIGIIGIVFAGRNSDDIAADSNNITSGTSSTVKETDKTERETEKTETTAKPSPEIQNEMNKTVELDNHDMVWGLTKSISKSVLNGFDGDIRVTLKTKYMDMKKSDDGNYYHCIRVMSDNGSNLEVKVPALVRDEYYNFSVNGDGMDFVFIIPKFFAEHVKDKVYFETENVMIESVIIEEDTYDKEIEFDGQYPGDWQIANDIIPLKELNGYDGDVRITLDLEVGTLGNGENLFLGEQPLSFIQPVGDDWFKLEVTADNLEYPSKDVMYMLVGEGKQQFSFTISQDELERFCKDGLKFHIYNLEVKKAYITGANGSKRKDGTSAEAETASTDAAESDIPVKPLHIRLNDMYPGDWIDSTINKTELRHFKSDMKIILDIEVPQKEEWSALVVKDGHGNIINCQAYNTGRDVSHMYHPYGDQTEFAFVITRAAFDSINYEIVMNGQNVFIKSATVEDYNPDDDEINPKAKIITLDNKYQGEWKDSSSIPKKELESFGGDVRVTLSLVILKEEVMPNSETDDYWVQIEPRGSLENEYGWVNIKADYIYPCYWHDSMYVLYDINVPDKFTFVISRDEIENLVDNGLCFAGNNFFVRSAALERA